VRRVSTECEVGTWDVGLRMEGAPNEHVEREFLGWRTREEMIMKRDQKEKGVPRGEEARSKR
jgi:hypothetical protein